MRRVRRKRKEKRYIEGFTEGFPSLGNVERKRRVRILHFLPHLTYALPMIVLRMYSVSLNAN